MTLQVLDSERKRRTGLEAAEELTGDVVEDVRLSLVKNVDDEPHEHHDQ